MSNDCQGKMVQDEIGLLTIFCAFWERKLWVALVTATCTIVSVLYASSGKPIYQARATLLPPTELQISSLNVGRGVGTEFAPYTSDKVFSLLKKNLVSAYARQEYYKTISETGRKTGVVDSVDRVSFSVEPLPERLVLVVSGESPESIVKHAKGFLDVVDSLAKKEVVGNSNEEFDVKRKSIKLEMAALRKIAKLRRIDQIHRLQEALSIAESIKLVKMPVLQGASFSASEAAGAMVDSMMYLKGVEVLKAELHVLENRVSDDPYIPALRTLQEELEVLSVRDVNVEDITIFNMDGRVASSEISSGPRKFVVVLCGFIFGVGLGAFLALAHFLIKRGRL
ncbi:hypothetical protein FXN65_09110 [Metapseudomonas lalkuanensis]|uniref:Polysaccharide chain length determinant N-terminal domain-containing protein n=1 Tax=Metapseudomonas lalkuanensis TaxID=2604832 RepID=A0A5J6QKB0_9GAMM|nr:Wzz/FepE/Etk N-terminal domain-containing protein [Pseudomonas lalkuanensis]QEY62225.1 hypothetical protein FXN65_09110 [Pseudomonas lalkuanensis]